MASRSGLRVAALHVHHGLSPNADAWLAHARRTCAAWARSGRPVRLHWARIDGRPAPGDSVEAWARRERYHRLAAMAREAGATLVLLAHHQRDQAETVLLQAVRGAGVAGLAAMPRLQCRDGLAWARPWLDVDPRDIAAYVQRHRLTHVDDESNRDPRWARSRLRTSVWPALDAAFAQAQAMLARTARWMGEAEEVLQGVARGDLALATAPDGTLDLATLRPLPPPRARLALRVWLHDALGMPAPASLVDRLAAEAGAASHGEWPAPGGMLRLIRGRLAFQPSSGSAAAGEREAGATLTSDHGPAGSPLPPRDQPVAAHLPAWPLGGPRRLRLPGWSGAWVLRPVASGGVAWDALAQAEARARQGGESFQAGPRRPARALKKQFQAAGIDRWHRDGPLLWQADRLLAVPGLGIDARALAAEGEAQVSLEWRPDAPGDTA
ncbi:MAG: tRNA lysidine(34) synthetase TilS [Ideonella sp.]|nr:tRNA lysidine(34) synthetase TilS [Ideonella sp.]